MKEKPARRRFGVDAVSQASKMNALALYLINQINQSFDATPEPIAQTSNCGARQEGACCP